MDNIESSYVDVSQVSKTYGTGSAARCILNNVSFQLQKGERVALLGHSGCGKSTLLNIIAGIDSIDSGDVSVAGASLTGMTEQHRTLFRRRHIGFIYQSFNLIQSLTASENIQLPLQLNKFTPQEVSSLCQDMLTRIGMSDRGNAFPDQLSGGEQQRIAIARAMIHSPALVLADEHTGNLDADTGRQMMELLNGLAIALGQTVLMVTHSRSVADTADRVVHLSNGQVASGDTSLAW